MTLTLLKTLYFYIWLCKNTYKTKELYFTFTCNQSKETGRNIEQSKHKWLGDVGNVGNIGNIGNIGTIDSIGNIVNIN